jgi:hypothetical protein
VVLRQAGLPPAGPCSFQLRARRMELVATVTA